MNDAAFGHINGCEVTGNGHGVSVWLDGMVTLDGGETIDNRGQDSWGYRTSGDRASSVIHDPSAAP